MYIYFLLLFRIRPATKARVATQYDKNGNVLQEAGDPTGKEKEITPEKLETMLPFIEELVVAVLKVGEEEEKYKDREALVLEYIQKAIVEKGNFGWPALVPYYFKKDKETEDEKRTYDDRELTRTTKETNFQKVCYQARLPSQFPLYLP